MSSLSLAPDVHASGSPLLIIERFMRDREGVWGQIAQEYRLSTLIREMLVSSMLALACYGMVIGFSSSALQALVSALKLPILFLLTLAICLPTLYLFNLFMGGRLSAGQVLALALSAITVTSIFTLAFAPITLFFLITAQSYGFFLLLNVAILALTGGMGLHFLVSGVRHINTLAASSGVVPEHPSDAANGAAGLPTRPGNINLIYVWLLLYAFVGTQLGWTLRPFFGTRSLPFQLFRNLEGSFYEAVLNLIMRYF